MVKRNYVDTCIWIDMIENRVGFSKEPFGEFAYKMLRFILASKSTVLLSNEVVKELLNHYTNEQVMGALKPFESTTSYVSVTNNDIERATSLAGQRKVPFGDALHAILARKSGALLVTRDNHFKALKDICSSKRPEDFV